MDFLITPLLLVLVGLLVSAFGTLVGFGGGVFMVPILIIFFNYPIEQAIGSCMSAMVPAALIASFFNYREKNIDYLVASLIQFPAMGGTVLGAFLVTFLPVLELQFTFAFFVIIVGFYLLGTPKNSPKALRHTGMMYRMSHMPTSFIRKNHQKHLAYRLNGSLVVFFGFLTGTIAGLFGIGGGFLQTPAMIKIFRMPVKIATSTSLFILLITSITGFTTHYWLGHVVWEKSLPLMLGFALGATVGQNLKKIESRLPRMDYLIGMGLFLAGITLIVNIILKAGVLFKISF
ncbi:sulfite exporter TauE/SafE family protein [Adhaeribacter swui]|uniref:sulfite exporter TauE/SafE family protein n=1 Tax=Adhaeribacter swui TaxID=2086471 RepID=UPI001E64FCB9|nr:sulfite exporter TauE/SafE family protein [Adhaeribacter swui]